MLPTRATRQPSITFNRGQILNEGIIPTGLRLLQDTYHFKVLDTKKALTEGINGKEEPVMKVMGLFQHADVANANGRIYEMEIIQSATNTIQEDIGQRSVLGELDHPSDAKIHLDRISHLVTRLWMEGRKVYGEAEILDNQPLGRCLRGLYERKVKTGVSSRGVGDMEMVECNNRQLYRVLPGYQFLTWDAVADPSVVGANPHVMESIVNRLIKPIKEQRQLFGKQQYENILIDRINKYFGIKDFGPRRK